MFANSVTTSQGSIQVLCNAWNLVASGVLLLNVFLHTVTLRVCAVPMSLIWDSDVYAFVSKLGLSVAPHLLLSVAPPPAGMMWTTVWPPL